MMTEIPKQPGNEQVGGKTPCPICNELTDKTSPAYPFCSKRCRMIDLGRWLGGDYNLSRPIKWQDEEQVD